MEKQIVHLLKSIELPVESDLWQTILGVEGVTERLRNNPRVLLIGTDRGLTLARHILETNPEAGITIVEKSDKVVQIAKKSLPEQVSLFHGDFLNLDLSTLPKQGLIISKHLIHFLSEGDLQAFSTKAPELGEEFYASIPPFANILVDRYLKKSGISYRKIAPKFHGTLYCFKQK